MKVLMIETGGWGGICHYTYNLANTLVKAGVQDLTVISGHKYELEDHERNFRLIKHFDPAKPYLSNISGLITLLRENKFSIIHIQSILSPRKDWIYILLSRFLRIPLIYTVHNILPHEEGERNAFGLRTAFMIIYKHSKRLVAHSEANRRELIREFGTDTERINVIPHGNYFFLLPAKALTKDEARKKLGLHTSGKVLLSFGAVRKYKGIDYLIRAFKRVVEKIPDARLLIAGTPMSVGEDMEIGSFHAFVEDAGLKDKVFFHFQYIPLKDIHIYFSASDVAVFPYLRTTESGSLQAALAFSMPIIATKVGSFGYAVEEGENGFLVPPGDEAALAEAIASALSLDEKALSEMGEYSRFIAGGRYNWENIGKKTKEMYEEVLNEDT